MHGWPLDSRTWRNVIPHLADNFTCHLFDLPGAGLSRWNPETSMKFSTFPGVVVEAVRRMGLERFLFVGHDSGGGLARMAIHSLDESVAGYVLGNTETPGEHSGLFRGLFLLGKTPLARPIFHFAMSREMTLDLFSLGRRWKGSELERELTQYFVRPMIEYPGRLDAALAVLAEANASDFDVLSETHEKITVPVHLVWGKKDRWFPLAHAERMMPGFRGETTLEIVEKAALLVHEECPQLFAEAVARAAGRCGLY